MNTTPRHTSAWPGARGGSLILLAVLAAVAGGALAMGTGGQQRGAAVAFAAVVAGVGGIAGWLASRRAASSPAAAVGGGLAATALRLAPPLAGLAWLSAAGGELQQAGADALLVIFYLALLATTIFLDIMGGRCGPPNPRLTPGSDGRPPPGV